MPEIPRVTQRMALSLRVFLGEGVVPRFPSLRTFPKSSESACCLHDSVGALCTKFFTLHLFGLSVYWERGSGGAQSAGVSQRVRVTGRDESQSVPPAPRRTL